MRICFITNYFDSYRGGNTVFADLFRSFEGRHEVTVVTREDRFKQRSWITEIIPVKSNLKLPWYSERVFAKRAVVKFSQILNARKFDVVIINQILGPAIVEILKFGIPTIYVIHHPVSEDIRLAYQESRGVLEKISWAIKYGDLARVQASLVKKFPNIVTVSQSSCDAISGGYNINSSKIRVINNGIDTDFFHKTIPTEPKTALTIGSYQHPRRGFVYLAKAYDELTKRGWKILDVGRRTNGQAKTLSNIPGVQMFGPVATREEIRDFYSRASVTLSSSLFEGFGLSIAESLSCGTPVAAFGGGGVKDVLNKVDKKMICELRDVPALVDLAINSDKQNAAIKHGQEYRQSVIDNFSLARMSKGYESILEDIVRG